MIVGADGQHIVRAFDGTLAAFEVKARANLPHGALQGVVHFGQFRTGYNIE
jgi:hypothetical protein